jgi:hypothetical protein
LTFNGAALSTRSFGFPEAAHSAAAPAGTSTSATAARVAIRFMAAVCLQLGGNEAKISARIFYGPKTTEICVANSYDRAYSRRAPGARDGAPRKRGESVKRAASVSLLLALGALLVAWAGTASGARDSDGVRADRSGEADLRDVDFGTDVNECPQAGLRRSEKPLRQLDKDKVEQISERGDDIRMNQDYSCFPQDETSISVNPRDARNVVGGANDYRLGWASSGFYSSTDRGNSWYDGWIPFPSLPTGDNLDGGGDPAVIHERNGVVFWTDINFNRTDDTNGIWTSRSTNGGFTWSRPCVGLAPPTGQTESVACGGAGDPRQPGDGTVTFNQDPTPAVLNGDAPFDDKEYNDAGPRPAGVQAQCYTPPTRTPARTTSRTSRSCGTRRTSRSSTRTATRCSRSPSREPIERLSQTTPEVRIPWQLQSG